MQDAPMRLAMIRSIIHRTQRGFILVGDLGEMVSSIILLFAFDKTLGPALLRTSVIPWENVMRHKVRFSEFQYLLMQDDCTAGPFRAIPQGTTA
ncbi:uncharacterized protein ASPGLDRAFT_317592 [Aspergillus glaucus CBS 516.65]|uniref:Uncharacterized protein n=1 Tax=Aspergillus glaucus CBS 516.65 TaxID=1160497 RepID=A0A1L9VK78_ASPGL|nr:hypothetical protein ASPGLDRAFT_317592 [Aspergillus glaucus CBS 516.65]OJJ84302.1 hypothetical protein ASPGLDRAFT_317592 [Aspergillus glaucus CBS 516.65]